MSRRLAPMALAVFTACVDGTGLGRDGQRTVSPSTSVHAGRPMTVDDLFEAVALEVPGFGGIYFDTEASELVVFLKDPSALGRAREKLAPMLRAAPSDVTGEARAADLLSRLKVRTAVFDFVELRSTYRRLLPELPTRGITLTDIDETKNRIQIGVLDAKVESNVQESLARLKLPVGLVEVDVVPPTIVHTTLQQYHRPLIGGLQISTTAGGICTLGHSVRRTYGWGIPDGNRYYITNAHCTSVFGAVTSDQIGQPTLSNPFGMEIADPPLVTNAEEPLCPLGRVCRYSDIAMLQVTTADTGCQVWWGALVPIR